MTPVLEGTRVRLEPMTMGISPDWKRSRLITGFGGTHSIN
jgi:hypothetical protein